MLYPSLKQPVCCCAHQGALLLMLSSFVPGLAPSKDGSPATYLQTGALSLALTVIAFGTGGIKPNVSAFGADQLDGASAQVSTLEAALC